MFSEDLIWGDCSGQETVFMLGEPQKHVQEAKKT